MSVTKEQRETWRVDAQKHNPGSDPKRDRILALLAALEEQDAWIEEHALVKTLARAERAEAKVARVRALAADLDSYGISSVYESSEEIGQMIYAALADPEPRDEGGES